MARIPDALATRIAPHNRSCWLAATLSSGCAGVAWTIAGAGYTGVVLVWEALQSAESPRLPPWFFHTALCAAFGLLAIAGIERPIGRFRPVSDRPIIGRHLVGDVLLFPAWATLLIWEHVNARIVLSRTEREAAWMLVEMIATMRRADSSLRAREFAGPARLSEMLTALQIVDWIDLYRGEEDFYYRVRSEHTETISSLVMDNESS